MPTEVDRHAVQRLLAAGTQLIDVLTPQEYAEEHLRGAINIPLKQLTRETAAKLDPSRPAIVYCHDYQ